MAHINVILIQVAREFIVSELRQTEKIMQIVDFFDIVIKDTGQLHDPSHYPVIKDFLQCPAGHEHGRSKLRAVLVEKLTSAAQARLVNPTKTVDAFLYRLERLELAKFIQPPDDAMLVQKERLLRDKLNLLGYRLSKSRTRNPFGATFGLYDVFEVLSGSYMFCAPRQLAPLERWVDEELALRGLA